MSQTPETTGGPGAARPTGARPTGATFRPDADEPLTAILVRHGVTPHTTSGAYSGGGVPGPSLSGDGRIQAAQAADLVHRIGRKIWPDVPRATEIVASPMVRTQETAAAISRRLGRAVVTDPRLAEGHFGEWEGLTADEIEVRWPGQLREWHESGTFAIPGGESIAQTGERLATAMDDLIAGGPGRTVVVVSHAVALRSVIGTAFGAPASQWHRIRIAPASVSMIRYWADGTSEITAIGIPPEI
ncbi:fructose-2,6-bisphosphatase [Sanguibacter keddieii DSM 10542]|uniref:Fructose-2,6-bisphosphatase n=1 Tax=Sanguibacter keddieii (strain ATCC 51767 / DSM 10542 / NCFB 3025 / ST-74) TaxID=446469 RepID=D1BFS1_SANKS|nr:histidine phosphatase family protein [Sanguibacter keddieii]ACZ21432.1 fructose-2,6-bisphosphatase [Sanguibacter keddieii DSM 10542]